MSRCANNVIENIKSDNGNKKDYIYTKNLFYLPDSKEDYNASAEFVILTRDDAYDLSVIDYPIKASDTGKFDFWWHEECDRKVFLLVRKVGHYAGCQFYYFQASDTPNCVRIMYYPGKGYKNQSPQDYGDVDTNKKKPWEENGHVICDTDVPSNKSGSTKRQKTTGKARQGTGFLKILKS